MTNISAPAPNAPEELHLTPDKAIAEISQRITARVAKGKKRILVGIAGGPGSGKSTITKILVDNLNADTPGTATSVPMDGFHMRHETLTDLGIANAKGVPHTFEAELFLTFLSDLKQATTDIRGPAYSRQIEDVVDDVILIAGTAQILVVEGNYLLHDDPPWRAIADLLEFSVFINIPRERARTRLLKRHAEHGLFTKERNIVHVDNVDLANYDLAARSKNRADLIIHLDTKS